MLLLFAMALTAQLPTVIQAEFTGEDELLFARMGVEWIRVALGIPGAFERIQMFYYPPLQSMSAAPLIWIWGPVEWVVRLPGAAAAAVAAPLLFWMMRRSGAAALVQWCAAAMMSLHGVLANHAYALTCGLFAGSSMLSAVGLYRFVSDTGEKSYKIGWIVACAGWVLMAASLPDAFFYLPVLAVAYAWRRGFRVGLVEGIGWGLILLWTAVYAFFWFWEPRIPGGTHTGAWHKIHVAFSNFGAFRIRELFESFAAGSSWLAVMLAPICLPLGWRVADHGMRAVALYFALPLGIWTFVLGYANVRSAHMLLAFPAYAALWSLGAHEAGRRIGTRHQFVGLLFKIVAATAVITGVVQAVLLHGGDFHELTKRLPDWVAYEECYPQGRRLEILGQAAAGVWIRRGTLESISVYSPLGGSFDQYYCERPPIRSEMVGQLVNNIEEAKSHNARYLALPARNPEPRLMARIAANEIPLVAKVQYRGKDVLHIFDLWREPREPAILDAEKGRRRFREIQAEQWRATKQAILAEASRV